MELRELGGTDAPNRETGMSVPPACLEPVTRHYRPQSAALDDLGEVLYRHWMKGPA
jgi:hypothetical protein